MKKTKVDENLKKVYISTLENSSEEGYYLSVIGTKILSSQGRTIGIDYERLYDELVYFKYYSEMSKDSLINFFTPLILVNRGFKNYEKDVVDLADKLTTFYKDKEGYNSYILDVFCYDIFLRNLINNRVDFLEILEEVKNGLLEFNPFAEDKQKNVKFQMKKIKYIEEAHKLEDMDVEMISIPLFRAVLSAFNREEIELDKGLEAVYKTVVNLLKKEEVQGTAFEKAMADYLLKLRYFEIQSPKYLKGASPRNFLKMEVGETIQDPIMNKAELISKEKTDTVYKVEIMTKTGKYRFEFKLK